MRLTICKLATDGTIFNIDADWVINARVVASPSRVKREVSSLRPDDNNDDSNEGTEGKRRGVIKNVESVVIIGLI